MMPLQNPQTPMGAPHHQQRGEQMHRHQLHCEGSDAKALEVVGPYPLDEQVKTYKRRSLMDATRKRKRGRPLVKWQRTI